MHNIKTASDDDACANPDFPGRYILPHQVSDGGGPQQRSILKRSQWLNYQGAAYMQPGMTSSYLKTTVL